jgi:hypothetical protein
MEVFDLKLDNDVTSLIKRRLRQQFDVDLMNHCLKNYQEWSTRFSQSSTCFLPSVRSQRLIKALKASIHSIRRSIRSSHILAEIFS